MAKYFINHTLSTTSELIFENNKDEMFEYQPDTGFVYQINRFEQDEGMRIHDSRAKIIRKESVRLLRSVVWQKYMQ